MKSSQLFLKNRKLLFFLFYLFVINLSAQTNAPMRRPISPSSPMWLIHIDSWNYPDPQRIIDLIPKDIRPYVVMNISLSINHDVTTSRFMVSEYGYETAKSWLRTCAQNRMWATVQCSSGGFSQFSDFDLSVYEEFFRDYPNFIGFNYAEQFWGFDGTDPLSAKWSDRINHLADLLKLSNKYGGYTILSWCGNEYGQSINPIGMLKRIPAFTAACEKYSANYILCDKYTQVGFNHDMESLCLGAYLSGYSGQYGIRYDGSGWTDATGVNQNFTLSSGVAPHFEHLMLNGATVIDGPELIWTNCFKGINTSNTSDGFTKRNWTTFQHFDNVQIDMFRKILDGTIRIPSKKEVIERAKYAIINDVTSGADTAVYCSPQSLYNGLYAMDVDQPIYNYQWNKSFFKKSGRYPTIPVVYKLKSSDADANSFQFKMNKSAYRWNTITTKTNELNQYFPQQSSGDLYVGRNENALVTYNPYKTQTRAKGIIPLKYNTCDSLELKYSRYSGAVVKEYPNKISFYMSNFEDEYDATSNPLILTSTTLKGDTIKIYGSTNKPTWTSVIRGTHNVTPVITENWSNNVLTLYVLHNGPLDLDINCAGTASNRLSSYTTATLSEPAKPTVYTGPRQYEAECFDYMNVNGVVTSGYSGTVRNYTGQGYVKFGTASNSAIRDTVTAYKKGIYNLQIKYSVTSDVSTIDLYVNGSKVSTPTFTNTTTYGNWLVYSQDVSLNEGQNVIMLKANATSPKVVCFDNIIISQGNGETKYDFTNDSPTTSASTPAAQFVTIQSGSAGVISYTDTNSKTDNCFKTYSVGSINGTGVADLDLFPSSASDYYVVWKENFGTAGAKKGMLLRGTGSNGSCPYASGMKQGYLFIAKNNDDNTVTLKPYIAGASGLTAQPTYTSSFQLSAGQPCWYRARAVGNQLNFECSSDSLNWVGGAIATFTDTTYTSGSTELVWGLNSGNFNWAMDNISFKSGNIFASLYTLNGFAYVKNSGPSANKIFTVSGNSLFDNVVITVQGNYEVSTDATSGFASSVTLPQTAGTVALTTIYVRLKAGLGVNDYSGTLTISSNGIASRSIDLSGSVSPESVTRLYDFSHDVATTSATVPPALNTSIGVGNTATAGVVSYTDASNVTSNVLKPYSGGNRNATGVIDLNLFSSKSTDYSVTWKEFVNAAKDYKVGVLLRGDASKIGDNTTGYVNGIMQGYLFIVYSKASGGSEFRIYKSTSTYNALSMLVNTGVSTLSPTTNQPVWYRASVSGTSLTSLKLEYSTDSITWNTGSTITDSSNPFLSGSTEFIWGLGVSNVDFYVDNITFYGIEDATSSIKSAINDDNNATVVSSEYFNIAGQKVSTEQGGLRGIYIVRNKMSNGKIITQKVLFK